MMSSAWLWLYLGVGLMLLELLVPGFVIFFFGLSAFTVGALRFLFGEGFTLTAQIAAFSIFSIFFLVALRRWVKSIFAGKTESSSANFENDFIGRVGEVTTKISPPLAGRVEIGDAQWSAISDKEIDVGATVKVIAQNNLTLTVESL